MPMHVGAVSDGGKCKKGKSKSTGDKSKGKGEGKDKNKQKGNGGDKTRNATTGTMVSGKHIAQSGATNVGIVELDCGQQKNGAVAGVQEPESEAEDVKAAQWE